MTIKVVSRILIIKESATPSREVLAHILVPWISDGCQKQYLVTPSSQNYLSRSGEWFSPQNYVVNTVVFHCSTQLNLITPCDFQIKCCVCLEEEGPDKASLFLDPQEYSELSSEGLAFRALLPATFIFVVHSPLSLGEAVAINWVAEGGSIYLKYVFLHIKQAYSTSFKKKKVYQQKFIYLFDCIQAAWLFGQCVVIIYPDFFCPLLTTNGIYFSH